MVQPDAFFLGLRRGRRFCIRYAPAAGARPRGAVLYVHPFAEELNKSRRMAALQSRAFAERGWSVLQIDLFGCGDSEGEFEDASWEQWRTDIVEAAAWLQAETGRAPVLWGLRAGCLLAREALAAIGAAPGLLLWQPAISGRQVLQQFLRLKVASQIIGEGALERTGVQQLRQRLAQGEALEVAGYMLSPALALGLEASELAPLSGSSRAAWLEVAASVPAELTPAARARVEAWRAAGWQVDARAVAGAAFWQTQEIAECADLVEATLAAANAWPA